MQKQSHPVLESQELASQLPMQSFQAQLGAHAKEDEAKRAAANAKFFILFGDVLCKATGEYGGW